MSKKILNENLKRVNFYDGQKITEEDLDLEQSYVQEALKNITLDFHSSGILKENIKTKFLFDSSRPGIYGENPSKDIILSGSYDGIGLRLDTQPSDKIHGNKLEVELSNSDSRGKNNEVYVLIVGTTYDPQYSEGIVQYEVLTFNSDKKILTENYYFNVFGIITNNFSGGDGLNNSSEYKKSKKFGGVLKISEADSCVVFSKTDGLRNNISPNFTLEKMHGSSSNTLNEEIAALLSPNNSITELFINSTYYKKTFDINGNLAISYGQKFILDSNNIQKVDLLLSVDRDSSRSSGNEFDWEGDLIFSIYELNTQYNGIRVESPLDGDPKLNPVAEISYDQSDLENIGYYLNDSFQKVSISFASSNIANPSSDVLKRGSGYAIVVSRRGSNSYGKINIAYGDHPKDAKIASGVKIPIKEIHENQKFRYSEFDPDMESYIEDKELSFWFVVHSLQFEITSGIIYASDGLFFSIPKLDNYVGETKVNFTLPLIDLKTISSKNYIGISRSNNFSDPSTNPRTGNFVYKRIEDYPQISIYTEQEWAFASDSTMLLCTVEDKNDRGAEEITGSFDYPGLLDRDFFYIINPSSFLMSQNLVGRKFIPDVACDCNKEYIITKSNCIISKYGDFNNDGRYDLDDISKLLSLTSNTINSIETERNILGGAIDYIDFLKADLNGDGTIDSPDIELLEQATLGSVNFSNGENFSYLKIFIETEKKQEDYPKIADISAVTAVVGASSLTFAMPSDKKALLVSPDDSLMINSGIDAGTYIITSKEIDSDGVTVTLGLKTEDNSAVVLQETASFSISINSRNLTNVFLDNEKLLNLPYESKNYKIYYNNFFTENSINICDERRFVERSFIEAIKNACECAKVSSCDENYCDLGTKNQKYLPGDLYIKGRILDEEGKTYSGDYEFANVTVNMPVGSLSGCQLDLYNSFIKASDNKCLTAVGYKAMKYSDGTYVGCEDIGADTDLTKGRVKIVGAIASLHVDAFVDGYAVDQQNLVTETESYDYISVETSNNYAYNVFDPIITSKKWSSTASGNFSATLNSTGPAKLYVETHTAASETKAFLSQPSEISTIDGDFIYDFVVSRDPVKWQDYDITNGEVKAFLEFDVANSDGSTANLELGYKVANRETKVYYSGKITDSSGSSYLFDFSIDAPEVTGQKLFLRLRRKNDVIFAYYYNPNSFNPNVNPSQEYIRIGQNLAKHAGVGPATSKISLTNSTGMTTGKLFEVSVHEVKIYENYSAAQAGTSLSILKTLSTEDLSRILVTFPLPFNSKTKMTSVKLNLISNTSSTVNSTFNIIPIDNLDLDNIGTEYNLAKKESTASVDFIVSSTTTGDVINGGIEIISMINHFLSNTGHISGQKKGFYIEPDPAISSDVNLQITNDISIEFEYEDLTTGVVFQIGVDLDPRTGIATFKTKNILYDIADKSKRTKINFGVHLKKSGFINEDVELGVTELNRIKYGIGSCIDNSVAEGTATKDCYFIVGDTKTGTFVQGPFPCNFYLGTTNNLGKTIEFLVTKQTTSSGDRFYLNGVESPDILLEEGATYVFDMSDSSLTGNKLEFSKTSDGTHGGGVEYTDGITKTGTPGSAGASVKFTIPSSVDDLFYFSPITSAMGAKALTLEPS